MDVVPAGCFVPCGTRSSVDVVPAGCFVPCGTRSSVDVVPAGCCDEQLHLLCPFGKEAGNPFHEYIRKTKTYKFLK